jgi:hypothetical protein
MSVPSDLHKFLREGYYTRIIKGMENGLKPRSTPDATVTRTENGWRLAIPAGSRGTYRLAQVDDYAASSRTRFRHSPPWTLKLRARVSASNLPGTWGFGLWNDPFGSLLGSGGTVRRLPSLPNAAWFFHASPPNWLSLRDEVPAQAFFAGTINSTKIPTLFLAPVLLSSPFLAIRPISRLLRKLAAKVIRQEATAVSVDVTEWHDYSINWLCESIEFSLDGDTILQTIFSPDHPIGLVIWIDNQFAAWSPVGRLSYGTLINPAAWLEIESFEMTG